MVNQIMKKLSAGLIVYRKTGKGVEVLIAHMGGPFHAKKDAGHWSIPKGEYDEGEDPKKTAIREFGEELGKEVPEGKWIELGAIKYKNGKLVSAWAIEGELDVKETKSNTFAMEWPPRSGKTQEFLEIDRAAYFSLSVAAQKLIPAQVELIERLAAKLNVPFSPAAESEPPSQPALF
jgi:predicted NUDIX family NTP pyrophosphohydrolase